MRRMLGWITCVLVAVLIGPGAAAAPSSTPDISITPADYGKEGLNIVSRLEAAGRNIRIQLQAARAHRDVVKTLCLNDKLNQIDVAIRSARERKQTLDVAIERKDHDQAGHALTMLTVLRQRGDRITAEAQACQGGDPITRTTGGVEPFIEPNLPEGTTDYPVDNVVVEPPACASCVQ